MWLFVLLILVTFLTIIGDIVDNHWLNFLLISYNESSKQKYCTRKSQQIKAKNGTRIKAFNR
jgi:uncharacterized protein YbcC (UPF0753/DUF2309 family)